MTYDHWKTTEPDPFAFDEPPQQWFECHACDGSGEIVRGVWGYEPGCGHGHMMEIGEPCGKCGGDGGRLDDAEPDARP